MDFLRNIKFLDIDYKAAVIPKALADGRIWVEGAKWVEPSEKHFKHRIRKFRKSSEVPKQWATSSAQMMLDRYSMDSISKDYDEALGEIIDRS